MSVSDPEPQDLGDSNVALVARAAAVAGDTLSLLTRVALLAGDDDTADDELARAIVGGEIEPFFQPIVSLDTGRVVSLEALARWRRPSGDFASPAEFIPVAERSDLIVDLDLAVMRRGLAELRRWQEIWPELRMSFNLSGRHLDRDDWVAAVHGTVEESGVSPLTVDLEDHRDCAS